MPLYEDICRRPECSLYDQATERYYATSDTPQKPCLECGGPTERLMSRFGIVWTGPITERYLDRDLKHKTGAHWAWERDGNNPTGKPRPTYIETWDDQRAFCKRNNVTLPSEQPRNLVVGEDGKSLQNTRGMPGTEL